MQPTRAPWSAAGPPAPQSAVGPGVLTPLIAGRAGFPPKMTAEELDSNAWKPAAKRITDKKGLDDFLESDLAKQYVGFILALNAAVAGRPLSDEGAKEASPAVTQLLAIFNQLEQRCEEIPPEAQSLRYGNPAFRTWFGEMRQEAVDLVASVLPEALRPAAVELAPYFIDSFGNQMRIDYGTGHETNFCVFLFCLARLGVVEQGDARALVLRVFHRYIQLMRKIQTTYWLEPAGSHGVWGLDDYHFLPFIWGSSQLVDHPEIRPKSVNNDRTRADYEQDYMYLQCVSFVKQVKKGPLAETSPMLYDVSAVPSWTKVNSGLLKMYQVEVLSKLPIMQHFLFSSMVPFPEHGASG